MAEGRGHGLSQKTTSVPRRGSVATNSAFRALDDSSRASMKKKSFKDHLRAAPSRIKQFVQNSLNSIKENGLLLGEKMSAAALGMAPVFLTASNYFGFGTAGDIIILGACGLVSIACVSYLFFDYFN